MHPVIVKIGPLTIHSYGFMMVVAFYTCYFLLNKDLKRLGYQSKLASDIIFFAALGGVLGAKIYYLIENLDRVLLDPVGMIFSGAGLVWLGGLIGGMLGVSLVVWRNKLRWIVFADIVAPFLILGYAIGRVGCFLVGDDYGFPTHLPWGLAFPEGIPPTTYHNFQTQYPWIDLNGFEPGLLRVHPTQLYEILLSMLIFAYLWKKRTAVKVTGSLFFTYFILVGIERLGIEFIRTNTRYLFSLTGAQWLALIMIGIGTYFLFHPVKTPTSGG